MNNKRYNFSSRAVIAQDPQLRIDQVTLPYKALVIMLQPQIINILNRLYNMSYSEAYNLCYKALANKDERVASIIRTIIKNSTPEGLPVIINRNPTINYGSILQMYCIDFNDDMIMQVPLQVLAPLAADQISIGICTRKIFSVSHSEVPSSSNTGMISFLIAGT